MFSNSELFLRFGNGYQLTVKDGPYENWQYVDNLGASVIGGVGRLIER